MKPIDPVPLHSPTARRGRRARRSRARWRRSGRRWIFVTGPGLGPAPAGRLPGWCRSRPAAQDAWPAVEGGRLPADAALFRRCGGRLARGHARAASKDQETGGLRCRLAGNFAENPDILASVARPPPRQGPPLVVGFRRRDRRPVDPVTPPKKRGPQGLANWIVAELTVLARHRHHWRCRERGDGLIPAGGRRNLAAHVPKEGVAEGWPPASPRALAERLRPRGRGLLPETALGQERIESAIRGLVAQLQHGGAGAVPAPPRREHRSPSGFVAFAQAPVPVGIGPSGVPWGPKRWIMPPASRPAS